MLVLLKRDFSPIIEEDIPYIKQYAKQMYFFIQNKAIVHAESYYKQHGNNAIIELYNSYNYGYKAIYYSIIWLLKQYEIDLAFNDNELIINASGEGHVDVVKLLLSLPAKYRINITTKNNFPIIFASSEGHTDIVKILIDYGADPAARQNRPLVAASQNGHTEVVKLLLSLPSKYGINPTILHNRAIMEASRHDHRAIIKLLLQDNRVVNSLTEEQLDYITQKLE